MILTDLPCIMHIAIVVQALTMTDTCETVSGEDYIPQVTAWIFGVALEPLRQDL